MRDGKKVRLAGIAFESLANGPGIRRVLFAQGCRHNCKKCFNPDTHPFNGGELKDIDELVKDIRNNPMLRGVTFSGGDPLEQADKFAYIGERVKECGLDVWAYTGYTFEYIIQHKDKYPGWNDILNCVDVLVDGRFEEEKACGGLKFRGSSNQRIIDVKKSLENGKTTTLDFDTRLI